MYNSSSTDTNGLNKHDFKLAILRKTCTTMLLTYLTNIFRNIWPETNDLTKDHTHQLVDNQIWH